MIKIPHKIPIVPTYRNIRNHGKNTHTKFIFIFQSILKHEGHNCFFKTKTHLKKMFEACIHIKLLSFYEAIHSK